MMNLEKVSSWEELSTWRNSALHLVLITIFLYVFSQLSFMLFYKFFKTGPSAIKETTGTGELAFARFNFYEAANLDRYLAFKMDNPQLTEEEVTWRVNAGLDRSFYTGVVTYGPEVTDPLLVNKYYRVADDFVPQDLVKLSSGLAVTAETKEAFINLRQGAAAENLWINEVSTYRSVEYQKNLYNRYLKRDPQKVVDTYSARPGHSEHNTGRAIDVYGSNKVMNRFGETAESAWINEHSWEYGFIIRYPQGTGDITGYKYEPWHLTYVGVEIATFMRKNGIKTLEEYVYKWQN